MTTPKTTPLKYSYREAITNVREPSGVDPQWMVFITAQAIQPSLGNYAEASGYGLSHAEALADARRTLKRTLAVCLPYVEWTAVETAIPKVS